MSQASTNLAASIPEAMTSDWREAGHRYFSVNYYFNRLFGQRVQKVSIDAGFTCPNVDGTAAIGGCTFCDNRSFSPSRRLPLRGDIEAQMEEGIQRLKRRYKVDQFIAYFQPATNTYAPVEKLRPLYMRALAHEKIVGLAIGTRPDCVPDEVLDLLEEIASKNYLSVEYGMQTMHNRSLDAMNRGHHHDAMIDAMERSKGRGFEISAHLILGLQDESHADMLASAKEMARLGVDAVKIHNLYAVKNTILADQLASGEASLISRDDYITTLVDIVEQLPPSIVLERLSGDAPPDYFIGPSWCLDKPGLRAAIDEEMERRDTWQGKQWKQ